MHYNDDNNTSQHKMQYMNDGATTGLMCDDGGGGIDGGDGAAKHQFKREEKGRREALRGLRVRHEKRTIVREWCKIKRKQKLEHKKERGIC